MSRTILIVEDDPDQRRILSTYLQFVGGEIVEATNGEEAVRVAGDHRPELILLDISMPVMDGWETVRRLQSDPDTRSIPVIAITGHDLAWGMLEEAGFCGYLKKPLALYEVLREVERCLGPLGEVGGGHEDPGEWRRG